jgi:hypothetical protein
MVQLMALEVLAAAQVRSVELCSLEEMELLGKEMQAVLMAQTMVLRTHQAAVAVQAQ